MDFFSSVSRKFVGSYVVSCDLHSYLTDHYFAFFQSILLIIPQFSIVCLASSPQSLLEIGMYQTLEVSGPPKSPYSSWKALLTYSVTGAISSDLYRFSCLDIWISFFFKLWVHHFSIQISIMDAQIWFISIVVKLTNISLAVFIVGHFWPMSRHENQNSSLFFSYKSSTLP